MRKSGFVTGFFAGLFVAVVTFAGEVNLPHIFQPNTKARASEVNANFEAVRNAVNDNNSRIQNLENTTADHNTRIQSFQDFQSNIAGSSCGSGNAVTGFSPDGTPQCEDMNKGTKILSVTYPASCLTAVSNPSLSVPVVGTVTVGTDTRLVVYMDDVDGVDNGNQVHCPIVLPEGSKILKVIAYVHDNASDAGGYIYISSSRNTFSL